jgi:hypothetical protein
MVDAVGLLSKGVVGQSLVGRLDIRVIKAEHIDMHAPDVGHVHTRRRYFLLLQVRKDTLDPHFE